MIKQILLVGLGGGVGSICRYLFTLWSVKRWGEGFPMATFGVNITGCLLIGLLVGLCAGYNWMDQQIKLLLITGFCGGYTTFSTFSLENWGLLETGNYGQLFFYTLGSVVFGITAVWLGLLLSRLFV